MKEMIILSLVLSLVGMVFLVGSAHRADNRAAVGAAIAVTLTVTAALIMYVFT